jgi:hypothetical protein
MLKYLKLMNRYGIANVPLGVLVRIITVSIDGGIFVLRRLRDIFYINAFPENNEIVYFGMSVVKSYHSLLVL